MKLGIHADTLGASLASADRVWVYRPPGLDWDIDAAFGQQPAISISDDTQSIVDAASAYVGPGDRLVIMSNGGFDNIHARLAEALATGKH